MKNKGMKNRIVTKVKPKKIKRQDVYSYTDPSGNDKGSRKISRRMARNDSDVDDGESDDGIEDDESIDDDGSEVGWNDDDELAKYLRKLSRIKTQEWKSKPRTWLSNRRWQQAWRLIEAKA